MQYTWGSHGGLATLTLAHINVQKIVFVWSVNPAKKTADSPPLSGAGCQKKKKIRKRLDAAWVECVSFSTTFCESGGRRVGP